MKALVQPFHKWPLPKPASVMLDSTRDPNHLINCVKSGPVGQEPHVTGTAGIGAREEGHTLCGGAEPFP